MHRLVVSILIGLAVAACDHEPSAAPDDPLELPEGERYGGTVVIGNYAELGTLNPLYRWEHVGDNLVRFVAFMPVIGLDETFDPVPRFAKSWEIRTISPEEREITFHLRDDVYWHDGVKTTAWDLEFAYGLTASPEETTVVDSFTFRVRVRPQIDPLLPWTTTVPLPRHLLQHVSPEEMEEHPYGRSTLVGNGPFRFVSRNEDGTWTFAANPDYPQEMGGRPYLDTLVLRHIPKERYVDALLDGTIDVGMLAYSNVRRVKDSSTADIQGYSSTIYTQLVLNHRREFFRDAGVRRALTLAIDRQAIIDQVLDGYGQVANTLVPPLHWAHDASAGMELDHDPERAKALLRAAGWEDRDGDGVLESARGTPFRFRMLFLRDDAAGAATAPMIEADLKKVGIDATIVPLDYAEWLQQTSATGHDFDAWMWSLVGSLETDVRFMLHCGPRVQPTGYCDTEMNRLVDTISAIADRSVARPY